MYNSVPVIHVRAPRVQHGQQIPQHCVHLPPRARVDQFCLLPLHDVLEVGGMRAVVLRVELVELPEAVYVKDHNQ